MILPQLNGIAEIAIGHILNSLPEGMLVALFAWLLLRFLPRQNSGTRFAVWFVALLAVALLPLIGGGTPAHSSLVGGVQHSPLLLPASWGLLLFLLWFFTASVAILRLVIGLWHLRKLRKSCVTVDVADLDGKVRATVAHFGSPASPISRSVTLATSECVSVPSAIGFFKPTVVLPTWALRELPPDELNVVLLHEFAHLRRWDDWTNLLQKFVQAVLLFHPAVWWIQGRLSLEREMACDDQVLAETANPRGYAKCLVSLLEKSFARRGWAMAQAAVDRAREASIRLAQILDTNRPNSKRIWKPALGVFGALALSCVAAVQHAPQFVAFERHPLPVHSDRIPAALAAQSNLSGAMVVPAAMKISSSQSHERVPRSTARKVLAEGYRHADQYSRNARRVAPARWVAESGTPLEIVVVRTREAVEPGETLLIVRTTQRVGQNSWIWSVGLWRITSVPPGTAIEPVAKKT
jgi:beta-lactamase regulating signal transducer with metallopeptidase domain